jgi:hypothetical protein
MLAFMPRALGGGAAGAEGVKGAKGEKGEKGVPAGDRQVASLKCEAGGGRSGSSSVGLRGLCGCQVVVGSQFSGLRPRFPVPG